MRTRSTSSSTSRPVSRPAKHDMGLSAGADPRLQVASGRQCFDAAKYVGLEYLESVQGSAVYVWELGLRISFRRELQLQAFRLNLVTLATLKLISYTLNRPKN